MDDFGLRVRSLMDESSMSYKQFAETTGISESGLKNWLYRKKSPHAASVLIIAEAFDVSCDWLLGASDKRRKFGE